MTNFAYVEDIESFLQIEITAADRIISAERALMEATGAIRNYCCQFLEMLEDDEIVLDSTGGSRIFLPELPVIRISRVVEDGVPLLPTDYKLGQHGILYRVGRNWAAGIQVIEITYSHGYNPLPDDIVAVCTRAASRTYQAGLRSADNEGVPGVSSKSLGDFSVSFSGESGGGGIGEGIMGASAARLLLISEKDLLNRYRV